MLTYLSIRDYTLIDALDLELDEGMTVISGETGAGKSIILDALGLALGDRADAEAVRQSAERAEIHAHFDLTHQPETRAWLAERELESDTDAVLRRVLGRNGRSRAYINGRPCPLQSLRELGQKLIDIHGQHEHQRLLQRDAQRELLDAYAGLEEPARELAARYRDWRHLERRLEEYRQSADEQQSRLELLAYQVEELNQLAPEAGELERLEQEQSELAGAEALLQGGEEVRQLAFEAENANLTQLLHRCLQVLESLPATSPTLENSQELFRSAQIQVEEAGSELTRYLDRIEVDPQRLQQVDERLALWLQLARKHRVAPAELAEVHAGLSAELDQLSAPEARLDALEAERDAAESQYMTQAQELSKARALAATRLAAGVNRQLQALGMAQASLEVALSPQPPAAEGLESVNLLISTNPGQPPRALARVASGGELSRISLAIQVVTAKTSTLPVLAFDEVDVGVGGAVAEVVGRLLRELGRDCQVLCVTHLPQVAAQGDQHLYVSKDSSGAGALSSIRRLEGEARVAEVARMLGGLEVTRRSLDHAAEMLTPG